MGALILSTFVWVVLLTDSRALEPPMERTGVEFQDPVNNVCARRVARCAATSWEGAALSSVVSSFSAEEESVSVSLDFLA